MSSLFLTINVRADTTMSRSHSDGQVVINIWTPSTSVFPNSPGRVPSTPTGPGLQASAKVPDAAPVVEARSWGDGRIMWLRMLCGVWQQCNCFFNLHLRACGFYVATSFPTHCQCMCELIVCPWKACDRPWRVSCEVCRPAWSNLSDSIGSLVWKSISLR